MNFNNFNISITLIWLFFSSDTSHLVIFCSFFIFYTFYVSLFDNKISIRALLNVFLFEVPFFYLNTCSPLKSIEDLKFLIAFTNIVLTVIAMNELRIVGPLNLARRFL